MINIDIDNVMGEVAREFEPAPVPTADVVDESAIDHIILIVVMGYQRRLASVPHCFVISVEVTKVAPAIFIDDFSACEERMGPLDSHFDQGQAFSLLVWHIRR